MAVSAFVLVMALSAGESVVKRCMLSACVPLMPREIHVKFISFQKHSHVADLCQQYLGTAPLPPISAAKRRGSWNFAEASADVTRLTTGGRGEWPIRINIVIPLSVEALLT